MFKKSAHCDHDLASALIIPQNKKEVKIYTFIYLHIYGYRMWPCVALRAAYQVTAPIPAGLGARQEPTAMNNIYSIIYYILYYGYPLLFKTPIP